VFELINRTFGKIQGKKITILGLAFKPDVDDLRESPAIEVARMLIEAGADVIAYEPNKKDAQIPELTTVPNIEDAIKRSDLLVLLVAHTTIKNLNPVEIAALTDTRLVVDTVNIWDPKIWEPIGFNIHRLGVGRAAPTQ